MLKVKLLGQFAVHLDSAAVEIPSRAAQSLLAYLLLHRATTHRREHLAGLLWPDTSDKNALRNLRLELWRIRKAIGSAYIVRDDIAITFEANSDDWIDVAILEKSSAANATADDLIAALSVYQGDLLPGFYDEWVGLERERLRAVFEQQMQRLLECLVAEQRWSEVLAWAERWIALGQSPEPAYRALMVAHHALGDMSKVHSVYQRCVESLRELGLEPSEETRALYTRLISGEHEGKGAEALKPKEESRAPGESPFKGLQYFDEADADIFFGRERLTAKLVGHLRTHPLLVVIGASGSGKSSLVRAGLVPALKRGKTLADGTLPPEGSGRWPIHVITPTAHPLEALAVSLTPDSASIVATTTLMEDLARDPRSLHLYVRKIPKGRNHLLLVVDQFEELFTLCRAEAERHAFVDNLLTAMSPETQGPTMIVITLRADFYAHCAQYADLRKALAAHQEYIGPMSIEELRRAIEGPAQRGGWEFEPGLVDLILRDVGDEPGALPLLSHALLETWQRRRGRTLTFAGYTASGGVRGAIAKTAETVYQKMSTEQQAIARNIFLRLTELGEGTQDMRRRATFGELIPPFADARAAEAVLRTLADARLVTLSEDYAEVAHEALIREWPTLHEWLSQNREGLRLHRHLTETAQAWQKLNRDLGELYRGARLAQALEWAETHLDELNPLEREFLDASEQLLEREEAEREAQRQRELEAAQRLAEAETHRAEAERRRAEEQTMAAQQLRKLAQRAEDERRIAFTRELSVSAVNNLDVDPERSILLALQAISVSSAGGKPVLREAEEALHRAVTTSRVQLTLRGHTAALNGVAVSPDGRRLATASIDKTARVWDAITGKELLTIRGHTDGVRAVAFSPDGSRLATASFDKTAKVWDTATGKELVTFVGHSDAVRGVAFSPDGTRLATASFDKTAKVWDAVTGRKLLTLSGHTNEVKPVAFSPDGRRLITGSDDNTARVWDARTGKEMLKLSGHTNGVWGVAFSPNGTRLATVSFDGTTKVWDAASGQQLSTLFRGSNANTGLSFDSAGTRLVVSSGDGTASVWDVPTGQTVLVLHGHTAPIAGVAFSPDGTRVATAGRDGTARVWDVSPVAGREWFTLAGHSGWVRDVAYSMDGTRIATASADKTAKVWDAATGKELLTLSGHTGTLSRIAFSPDCGRLATISDDQTAKVWDMATGQVLLTLSTPAPLIGQTEYGVAFSPDGKHLAVEGAGFTATVFDATTGEALLTLSGHSAPVNAVAFSTDGTRLATASLDKTAKLWDAATGRELLTLTGHADRLYSVAFSRDGTRLATASADGTAKIWDAATGQTKLTLSGHSGLVFAAAFSPDGTRLATGGADSTAKVWDISNESGAREEPLTLYGHSAAIYGLAFSPDGKRLATASRDGTVRVWALRLEDIVAIAKSRVTRTLTADECQKFLHMEQCPADPRLDSSALPRTDP